MKIWAFLWAPALALTMTACSDDDDNGAGGGGGGASCDLSIPMAVTGELAPQYSWEGGAARDLSVVRVANLEFIANNPTACVPPTPDAQCEMAYTRTGIVGNSVTSPVMHGAAGSSSAIALTQEATLENGVQYQMTVNRMNAAGDGMEACGCLRFTAGTAASGNGAC